MAIAFISKTHPLRICLQAFYSIHDFFISLQEDVHEWLKVLGLADYWRHFQDNSYSEPNALADLKLMDKTTLSTTFEMTKPGHLKKLTKAIKQLKYPTAGECLQNIYISKSILMQFLMTFKPCLIFKTIINAL